MAYCFPPRGFQTPQTPNTHHDSLNSSGSQQPVVRPSSFQLPGQSQELDHQADQHAGSFNNWNHGGPYNFPPSVSGPHQFPPNGNSPHQFPPRGPSPNQFSNNPWGSGFRGQSITPDGRDFPPPQMGGGHCFQGGPGMSETGSRFTQRGGMQPGRGRGHGRHKQNRNTGKKNDKNNNAVKKKKEEELKYNCDVCDRGFKTEDLLQVHISEHVKCTAPGCKFEAHTKIVQLHKKLQHKDPKYKVQWLETPSEIKRWREERRKNYPTASNIVKRQEAQKKRDESGAVLQTKQFGKMKKSNNRSNRNPQFTKDKQHGITDPTPSESSVRTHEQNTNKQTIKRPNSSEVQHGIPGKQAKVLIAKDAGKSNRSNKGVSDAANGDPLSMLAVSDEESDQEDDGSPAITTQQAEIHLAPSGSIGSLGSLAAAYGDSSSSSSEVEKSDGEDNEEKEGDKEEPKETCPVERPSHEESSTRSEGHNSRQRGGGKGRGRGKRGQQSGGNQAKKDALNRNGTRQYKATLLEMLLAPDIRHERNVLLQCVRYVVNNNFLENTTSR